MSHASEESGAAGSGAAVDVMDDGISRSRGLAPGGMWRLAWRQHRAAVVASLATIAIGIAVLIFFRQYLLGLLTAAGCDPMDVGALCTAVQGSDLGPQITGSLVLSQDFVYRSWNWGMVAFLCAPMLVGAFIGASIFPGEFAHRTHVFALAGSIGPRRWWAVKTAVAAGPAILGFLVLGFVADWVKATFQFTAFGKLYAPVLLTSSMIPAAVMALVTALAVLVSLVTRRTLASLVVALLVGTTLVVAVAAWVAPRLLPSDRVEATLEGQASSSDLYRTDRDVLGLRAGYLDADGREVTVDEQQCWSRASEADMAANGEYYNTEGSDWNNRPDPDAYDREMSACLAKQGAVAEFTDYLPGSRVWPLRGMLAALLLALTGLCMAACPAALRRAVARR